MVSAHWLALANAKADELHMNHATIARLCDTSAATISRLMRGELATSRIAARVARALGLPHPSPSHGDGSGPLARWSEAGAVLQGANNERFLELLAHVVRAAEIAQAEDATMRSVRNALLPKKRKQSR